MNPSAELIGGVAAATQHRDREDIERSLVELVAQFLDADTVALFKLLRDRDGEAVVVPCIAATVGPSGMQVIRGAGETLQLADLPSWRRCLDKRAPRATLLTPGRFETVLPAPGAADEPIGLLRIVGPKAPDSRELMMVSGILQIIRNHLALIDYGERDTLTGLLNRRSFESEFGKVRGGLARRAAANPDSSAWLALVDLDHFKSINDTHGHAVGDDVLVQVGRVMQRSLRGTDQVYRFGGEEFAILLTDVPGDIASQAFERLRMAVERHDFPNVGRVTASLGWTRIQPRDSAAAALERADRALYQAKDSGRNRGCRHDSAPAT